MNIPNKFWSLALALAFGILGTGCASQMALIKGSAKQSVSVNGSMDSVFSAAAEAGKELGYKVNEKRAKNMVYASRGTGYAEFTTVIVRFSEAGGAVTAAFDANSNKGSDVVLQEYLTAFNKRARAR